MTQRAACEFALQNANVKAFLRVIREGESGQTDRAYQIINGGGHFTDFAEHPHKGLKTTQGGRASGAYQFLPSTWAAIAEQMGLEDFSPPNQDLGAVGLIQGRGALEDVLAGRFEDAIIKCRPEWTSLPGASENNGRYTMERARQVYSQYGGIFAVNSAVTNPQNTESKPMAPLLLALAPMIAELVPQVAKLFASGSDVSTRNIAAVEAVASSIVKASGSTNVQDAIERMQADPALTKQVQQAVVTDPQIIGLLEVGGGIAAAREAGQKMQVAEKSFLWNPIFWISLVLLPLASYVVFASITGGHSNAPWWVGVGVSAEARVGIVSSVISLIIGGICGIWFGTSYGSLKKDERAAAQAAAQ